MHDALWRGVEFKLDNAKFHFEKMKQSLQPPERTPTNVPLQASGAIIDTRWHRSFYAHLDALLPTTRSVSDVIKCCFGCDRGSRRMKDWFCKLPLEEKNRRHKFSKQFHAKYDCFTKLPLSEARNISVHRKGYLDDVTVAVSGMFGVTYMGGPTEPVPISAIPETTDPALSVPWPVRPMPTDFTIDGKELFEVCADYLKCAEALISEAREIAQSVHGTNALTPPS